VASAAAWYTIGGGISCGMYGPQGNRAYIRTTCSMTGKAGHSCSPCHSIMRHSKINMIA
jgi:hypothetical protein